MQSREKTRNSPAEPIGRRSGSILVQPNRSSSTRTTQIIFFSSTSTKKASLPTERPFSSCRFWTRFTASTSIKIFWQGTCIIFLWMVKLRNLGRLLRVQVSGAEKRAGTARVCRLDLLRALGYLLPTNLRNLLGTSLICESQTT